MVVIIYPALGLAFQYLYTAIHAFQQVFSAVLSIALILYMADLCCAAVEASVIFSTNFSAVKKRWLLRG
jgi:hypothetical protein